MLKLHNTLTRQTEEFKPIIDGHVSLYTCGLTVYNYAHIGNLRAYIFTDTLRRVLEISGYPVKQVTNFTDVGHLVSDEDEGEDKLEKGANLEGKDVWEIAEFYIDAYKKDAEALNILPPNGYKNHEYARATDFIPQQVELVKILIDKDFAYQTEQAIYFEVSKLADYGRLSGQKLADKAVGVRDEVITDPHKRNAHDFGLWFFTVGRFAEHTMRWPSPWGDGFPGWHLECSAIIHTILGDPIDIHTGGVDHIGTHHTNEMAQTEAAYGNQLANYWLHNEFVLVDGGKMSKSKNNFYTLADIISKGYSPADYRMMCLQAHYRSELSFSWANLESARNRLNRLRAMAVLRWQPAAVEAWFSESVNIDTIKNQLSDDLNTPVALASLSGLAAQAEEKLINNDEMEKFEGFLKFIDSTFGFKLFDEPDLSHDQKQLLNDRETARQKQDWTLTDKLRGELKTSGVEIRDTPNGQIWNRL